MPTGSPRIGAHLGSGPFAVTRSPTKYSHAATSNISHSSTRSQPSTDTHSLGVQPSAHSISANSDRPAAAHSEGMHTQSTHQQSSVHTHPSLAPMGTRPDIPHPSGYRPGYEASSRAGAPDPVGFTSEAPHPEGHSPTRSHVSSRASSSTITPDGYPRDGVASFTRRGGVSPRRASLSSMLRTMSNPMRGHNPAGSPLRGSQEGAMRGPSGVDEVAHSGGQPAVGQSHMKLPLRLPLTPQEGSHLQVCINVHYNMQMALKLTAVLRMLSESIPAVTSLVLPPVPQG